MQKIITTRISAVEQGPRDATYELQF